MQRRFARLVKAAGLPAGPGDRLPVRKAEIAGRRDRGIFYLRISFAGVVPMRDSYVRGRGRMLGKMLSGTCATAISSTCAGAGNLARSPSTSRYK